MKAIIGHQQTELGEKLIERIKAAKEAASPLIEHK